MPAGRPFTQEQVDLFKELSLHLDWADSIVIAYPGHRVCYDTAMTPGGLDALAIALVRTGFNVEIEYTSDRVWATIEHNDSMIPYVAYCFYTGADYPAGAALVRAVLNAESWISGMEKLNAR